MYLLDYFVWLSKLFSLLTLFQFLIPEKFSLHGFFKQWKSFNVVIMDVIF